MEGACINIVVLGHECPSYLKCGWSRASLSNLQNPESPPSWSAMFAGKETFEEQEISLRRERHPVSINNWPRCKILSIRSLRNRTISSTKCILTHRDLFLLGIDNLRRTDTEIYPKYLLLYRVISTYSIREIASQIFIEFLISSTVAYRYFNSEQERISTQYKNTDLKTAVIYMRGIY